MAIKKAKEEAGKIVKQLVKLYKPQKIILFGSASENTTQPNDLDFFIIKKDVPTLGIERIREIRWLINTKVATDYLVVTPDELEKRLQLDDPFVHSIIDKGTVMYG